MTERSLPPEIRELVVDEFAPMVIVDVDEVLALFMLGFERFVRRHGLEMRITRFALFENIYRPGASEPIDLEHGRALFEGFFDTDGADIDPAPGARQAVATLARETSIVILTNAPAKNRGARAAWLQRHGFPYPLVMNNGPKGSAVAALRELTAGPVAFVDDLLPNLESVAFIAPDVHRFQMVADERLRPLAFTAPDRHRRIDHWPQLEDAITSALQISKAPD
jgi:hypothetical protein